MRALYLHDDTFGGAAQVARSHGLATAFKKAWATAATKGGAAAGQMGRGPAGCDKGEAANCLQQTAFSASCEGFGLPICQCTLDNLATLAATACGGAVASAQTKWMLAFGLMCMDALAPSRWLQCTEWGSCGDVPQGGPSAAGSAREGGGPHAGD